MPDEARGWFSVSLRVSSDITIFNENSGTDPFKLKFKNK
jgi:hypothetical protein